MPFYYDLYMQCISNIHISASVNTKSLSSIGNESIEIRLLDIVNALKSINMGKTCGVDGLAAEHFIYADERIHVILLFYFPWIFAI